MSQGVEVVVRFRSSLTEEDEKQKEQKVEDIPIEIDEKKNELSIYLRKQGNNNKNGLKLQFDKILSETSSQEEIYEAVGQNISSDILNGYDIAIYGYGASKSGKTFTMLGPSIDKMSENANFDLIGIVPRILGDLFCQMKCEQYSHIVDKKISISCLEIYQEMPRDLLDASQNQNKTMQIENNMRDEPYVKGLIEKNVDNLGDALKYINIARHNRTRSIDDPSTNSIRSHMIINVSLAMKLNDGNTQIGSINFIDLAGTVSMNHDGQDENDASLQCLHSIVEKLSNASIDINSSNEYSDSFLTKLLKSSLGGKSKTIFICNVSANIINREKTIADLKFASRMRLVRNKVYKNKILNNADLTKKLSDLQKENDNLRERLNHILTKHSANQSLMKFSLNGLNASDNNNEMDDNSKSNVHELQETVSKLESRIDELMRENNDLNKLVQSLKSQKLQYQESEHAANEEIEVLMDEIMRLQDLVSDLEDKVGTFEKHELFMSSQQSVLNSKIARYEKEKKEYENQLDKYKKELTELHEYKHQMRQAKFKNLLDSQTDLIAGSLTKGALFDTLKNIINVAEHEAPKNIYQSEHELSVSFKVTNLDDEFDDGNNNPFESDDDSSSDSETKTNKNDKEESESTETRQKTQEKEKNVDGVSGNASGTMILHDVAGDDEKKDEMIIEKSEQNGMNEKKGKNEAGGNLDDFASEIAKQKENEKDKDKDKDKDNGKEKSKKPIIELKRNKESQVLLTEKQLIEMQRLLEEQVKVKMNAELQKLRTEYRIELSSLKDDLEESQDRYLQMSTELENERKKVLRLNSTINDLNDAKMEMESSVKTLKNQLNELETKLTNERERYQTLEKTNESLGKDLKEFKEKEKKLKREKTEMDDKIGDLMVENLKLQQNASQLSPSMTSVNQSVKMSGMNQMNQNKTHDESVVSPSLADVPSLKLENNNSSFDRMLETRQTVLRIIHNDDEIPSDSLTYDKLSSNKKMNQLINDQSIYLLKSMEHKLEQEKERQRKEQEKADEEYVRKLIEMESQQHLQDESHRRRMTQTQEEKDAEFARKLAEKQQRAFQRALEANPELVPNPDAARDPNFDNNPLLSDINEQGSNNKNNNNLLMNNSSNRSNASNGSNGSNHDNEDEEASHMSYASVVIHDDGGVVDGLLGGPPKRGLKSRLVGLLKRDKSGKAGMDATEYINAKIEQRKQNNDQNDNDNNEKSGNNGMRKSNKSNNPLLDDNASNASKRRSQKGGAGSGAGGKRNILELWQKAQMQLISGEVPSICVKYGVRLNKLVALGLDDRDDKKDNEFGKYQPQLSDPLHYLNYRHNDDEYVSDEDDEDEDEGWGITPGGPDAPDAPDANEANEANDAPYVAQSPRSGNDIKLEIDYGSKHQPPPPAMPPPKEIVEAVYNEQKKGFETLAQSQLLAEAANEARNEASNEASNEAANDSDDNNDNNDKNENESGNDENEASEDGNEYDGYDGYNESSEKKKKKKKKKKKHKKKKRKSKKKSKVISADEAPMAFGQFLQSDELNNNGNNGNNVNVSDYEVDDVSISAPHNGAHNGIVAPSSNENENKKDDNFIPMTFGLQEMKQLNDNNENINFSCQYGKLINKISQERESAMLVRIDNLSQISINQLNFKFKDNYFGIYSSQTQINVANSVESFGFYEFYIPLSLNKELSLLNSENEKNFNNDCILSMFINGSKELKFEVTSDMYLGIFFQENAFLKQNEFLQMWKQLVKMNGKCEKKYAISKFISTNVAQLKDILGKNNLSFVHHRIIANKGDIMYYSGKLFNVMCLFEVSVGIDGKGFITVRSSDEIASVICFQILSYLLS